MTIKEKIEKMHRETCKDNLKKASKLSGNETEEELEKIYSKALDINIMNLFNSFSDK